MSRLVLAVTFLIAIWVDPSQPSRLIDEGLFVLGAYVAVTLLHIALIWNDWWRESRLALPVHLLDIALFTMMVFLTEGYTSPFFTFFVFLILSATIRLGWRETALTTLSILILYYVAGAAALTWGGGEFDLQRLMFRLASLIVLSAVLIWFGINQQGRGYRPKLMGLFEDGEAPGALPIRGLMAHAALALGADRVACAWGEREEPWLHLATLEGDRFQSQRVTVPDDAPLLGVSDPARAFLFDLPRRRLLTRNGTADRRKAGARAPIAPWVAERLALGDGIAIPLHSNEVSGAIFACAVPGLCVDDLAIANRICEEASGALDRASSVQLAEDAAATRTRLGLARDLHDRHIQLLAGTAMRLEALRKAAANGKPIDADLAEVQAGLVDEQRDLRRTIDELKKPMPSGQVTDLIDALGSLAVRLGRQWNIACRVVSPQGRISASARLEHDLEHIVREAIANAVRHGKASDVTIALSREPEGIAIDITDNGTGLPVRTEADAALAKPWSLNERIHLLGGTLALMSDRTGSKLRLWLPEQASA